MGRLVVLLGLTLVAVNLWLGGQGAALLEALDLRGVPSSSELPPGLEGRTPPLGQAVGTIPTLPLPDPRRLPVPPVRVPTLPLPDPRRWWQR